MGQRSRCWRSDTVQRALDVGITLYRRAFFIDPALFADFTPQKIMERRHGAFLQLILLGCTALTALFLLIQTLFLWHTPLFMRLAVTCSFVLSMGCLRLTFTRWSKTAYYVFFSTAFLWMLCYAHLDPSGLSVRTVLAHALLAPLLLGITLFLPRRVVGWVSAALIVIALGSVMLLRVKHAFAPEIQYPHYTSAAFLLVLYGLVLAIALGWEISMAAGVAALQHVYLHELALEQNKEAFIHIASHELRAPLTPIALGSVLLEKRVRTGQFSSEVIDLATTISNASKRMQAMVDLLLDVTRIDINRFTLDLAPCDLTQIIREVAAIQESTHHRMVALVGLEAPLVLRIDENRIWQVLSNLISNALKHTVSEATVVVTVQIVLPNVQIIVADDGPGIPLDALEHLFTRYYQVAKAPEDMHAGFGLGLYVCRAIIQAHGGAIWVESAPGQGTRFIFTLPLADEAAPANHPAL